MGNQYGPYDLAKRVRDMKHGHAVEIASVSAVSPLVITIGNASYSAKDWPMYECWYEMQEGERKNGMHTGASVNCSEGSISQMSFASEKYESDKALVKYNVGDLLAVQQMEGDNAFIILSKVRRVT